MSYHLITLILLLFLSAFFSCSETSLFSLSKISIRRLRLDKTKNSDIIASLLDKPTDLLITILIGNMFANVFSSGIAASLSIRMFGERSVGLSIAVMTAVIVIFCEIMPKIIAIKNARRLSILLSPFILFFSKLVFPVKWLLNIMAENVLSLSGKTAQKTESDITKDELQSAVKVGYSKEGILDKEEAEMIEDVLQLSDKKVKHVMLNEHDMVAFSVNMTVEEMSYAIKEAELSRVPVYEKERTRIIGILYAKDLLKKRLELGQGAEIRELLRKPFYVLKDTRLTLLLYEFRTRKIHLALVNDEMGRLVGLVTLEDLLEEIIGDIRDKEALAQRIKKKIGGLPAIRPPDQIQRIQDTPS